MGSGNSNLYQNTYGASQFNRNNTPGFKRAFGYSNGLFGVKSLRKDAGNDVRNVVSSSPVRTAKYFYGTLSHGGKEMTHKIDRQLEMHSKDVLKGMIGKRLLSVSTDKETIKGNAAWVAQFNFDDESSCTIQASIDLIDYYGEPEDITILKVEEGTYREATPSLNPFPVNMVIQEITYVDYSIHSNNPEIDDSDYLYTFTDAIIMEFEDGTELSIELFSRFSELIDINVGENLINELTPISEYIPEAEKPWEIESSIARFSITAEH